MINKKYKPQLIARESAVKILYQMKIKDDSLQFSCTTGVGTKTYPRPVQAQYTAASGTTYDPTTCLLYTSPSPRDRG